jgi:hypothetical protein
MVLRGRAFTGSIVEEAVIAWLESLGYTVLYSPDIARVSIIWTYENDT